MLIGFQTSVIPASFTFGFLPVIPIVAISSLIIVLGSAVHQNSQS